MVEIAIKSSVWKLKQVAVERSNTTSRVSIEFDGIAIWFESDDTDLEPSIEAFASVLLLPSLHHGAKLRIDAPVDSQWYENIRQLSRLYSQWWGYDADCQIEAITQDSTLPPSTAVGLCFTAGVDSFYSLFHYPGEIDQLVFAHGYDIPLHDFPRINSYQKSLAEIAALTGKTTTIIRTNLREHPLFRSVSWDRTHGSALASLGLLLSRQIGRLIIPPSYASTRLRPWGSHPKSDPLFSSAQCQIIHYNTALGRLERIQSIANQDLVQNHLRVCYQNINSTVNCSACEKCVMTMVSLAGTGFFQNCKTFIHSKSLVDRVNELSHTSPHLVALWQDIAAIEKSPELRSAIYKATRRFKKPKFGNRFRLKRLKRLFRKFQRLYLRLKEG